MSPKTKTAQETQVPNVRLLEDKAAEAYMNILCNEKTKFGDFRNAAKSIGWLLAENFIKYHRNSINYADLGICPVMTAGSYLIEGVEEQIGIRRTFFVDVTRSHEPPFLPTVLKNNLAGKNPVENLLIIEPMVATAQSLIAVIGLAKQWGVKQIFVLSVLAAPQGIEALYTAHPDVVVHLAELAGGLNNQGYIINRSIGDFGDRAGGVEI